MKFVCISSKTKIFIIIKGSTFNNLINYTFFYNYVNYIKIFGLFDFYLFNIKF